MNKHKKQNHSTIHKQVSYVMRDFVYGIYAYIHVSYISVQSVESKSTSFELLNILTPLLFLGKNAYNTNTTGKVTYLFFVICHSKEDVI